MDAREDSRPFSYSGNDHRGNPHDLLEETRDGLWAAVHMVEACEVFDPTPMALNGLANLLRGLAATLESAQERLERCARSPDAAEDERETAFQKGAVMARRYPATPIDELGILLDNVVWEGRPAEGPSPKGKPKHVAAK